MARPILTLEEKFWQRVEQGDGSGCWIWTGGTNADGYGKFYVGGGRYVLAHRWAFALRAEEIPADLCVLHRCDNPPCVKLQHLFLGDRQVNGSDMSIKGRGPKSRRGLPYGAHRLTHNRRDGSEWKMIYQSRVRHRNKLLNLGTFATAAEASAVAIEWRNKLHALEMK